MAVHARTLPRDLRLVANDLPDDTEESIVGIEWHQEAASALAAALASIDERRGAGWGVCEEVALSGLRRLDDRPYSPRPDVFVLEEAITGTAAEVALSVVGPPLLVVEIASETTWANDVGDKRAAYEGAGVAEYLVFDPTGQYIAEQVRAWRLNAVGRFVTWDAVGGAWESRTLDAAFFVEGPLLRVRDHDGWTPSPSRRAALGEFVAQARAMEEAARADMAEAQARQETQARLQAEAQVRQETQARLRAEEELRLVRARLQALEGLSHRDDDTPSS